MPRPLLVNKPAISNEILTLDELKEVYFLDKEKASSLLNKALFINRIIKTFREEIKKPSTIKC